MLSATIGWGDPIKKYELTSTALFMTINSHQHPMNDKISPTMPEEGSKLKLYSLGIVANNKAMSSNTIQVTPIESLTMIDGELASIPVDQEVEGVDAEGNSYISKVTTDTAIEADWLPGFGATNRRTAPDVRRGERVLIWQYADTDQYYWTSLGLDDHLRKLETVVYSWSATTDEAADSSDPENSYQLEISTHTGRITLLTSKSNGEHCIFGLQINPKDGNIKIVDDLDNELVFDSKNSHLWMKNADGTLAELNRKNIKLYAPDKIHIEAVNEILMKAKTISQTCTEYNLKCSTGTVEGEFTFKNKVTFQTQTQHNGIISSKPIVGPIDTI